MRPIAFGYRLLKKCIVLDVTHLLVLDFDEQQMPGDAQLDQYESRSLSAQELRHHANDPHLQLDANLSSRLANNIDECWGVFEDEQLLSYAWLARNSIESENNRGDHPLTGVSVSFPEHAAFIYKAFTRESHRGKGLFPVLVTQVSRESERAGVRQLISTTDWTNQQAIRAFQKCGFKSLGYIWCTSIFGRKFIKGPSTAARQGIKIGKNARVLER